MWQTIKSYLNADETGAFAQILSFEALYLHILLN